MERHLDGTTNGSTHVDNEEREERYERELNFLCDHAGAVYFTCRFDHTRHLKGDGTAVIVLGFILNLLRLKSGNERDRRQLLRNRMWFRCPGKDIQEQLGMSAERQQRAIATLVEFDLIRKSRRAGNIIWIKVRAKTLKEIAAKDRQRKKQRPESGKPGNRESRFLKPGKPVSRNGESREPKRPEKRVWSSRGLTKREAPNPSNSLSKKKQTPAADADGRVKGFAAFGGKPPVPSFYESLASRLFRKCMEARVLPSNVLPSPRKPASKTVARWASDMAALERRGYPRAEIEATLDNYLLNFEADYMPVAHCGRSFERKYDKIVDRIRRLKRDGRQEIESRVVVEESNGICTMRVV